MAKTKPEPTGAEWKSKENQDGVTEWTLFRLGGATLPQECRARMQAEECEAGHYGLWFGNEYHGYAERFAHAKRWGEALAANTMAARFRRLARRLAK